MKRTLKTSLEYQNVISYLLSQIERELKEEWKIETDKQEKAWNLQKLHQIEETIVLWNEQLEEWKNGTYSE